MELIDYLRLLARRWLYVVALTLLGLLAAVLYLASATKTYSTSADVLIGADGADASATQAQARSDYILTRMPTYAALMGSDAVLQQVQSGAGKGLTVGQLAGKVSADVVSKTVLLHVTATDTSPARAAELANAGAAALGDGVVQFERPAGNGAAALTTKVIHPASRPSSPVSPHRSLVLALGLVVGLVLGLLAAALRDQAGHAGDGPSAPPLPPATDTTPQAEGLVPARGSGRTGGSALLS